MQFEYDPEKLIEEVKRRPGIWDTEDTDYRNKIARHQQWNEVVTELLQSDVKISKSEMRELEIQLQKKWKSIRDCFQKYTQNPNRTRKPYIYSKLLQFLLKNQSQQNEAGSSDSDEVVKPKKSWKSKRKMLNLRKGSSDDDDDNGASDNNDEFNRYSDDEAEVEVPPAKVRKQKPATDEFVFANVGSSADSQKPDSDDCDRMFLLSLLPHLKSIPEEYRINVKVDLMQVLRNANYSIPNRDQKIF